MNDEVYKVKFEAMEKALLLQAKEYERRLSDLNGEAGRLRDMQATYVPREVFDTVVKDMEKRIEILTAVNLKTEGVKSLYSIIPVALTIIGLFMMYYLKG